MIKLIACDIDGTVLEPEERFLPEELFTEIERLLKEDIVFCFSSGRQYANLRTLARHLADRFYYICDNGAIVYPPSETSDIISITAMDREDALEIAATVIRTPGLELEVSGSNTGYIYGKTDAFYNVMSYYEGMNLIPLHAPQEIQEEILKISVFSENSQAIYPAFQDKWGQKYHVAIAGSHWLDITRADKGTGIRSLCDYLGINQGDVLAFGDNYNDMPILDKVGFPFIKDTAPEDLLQRYPNRFSNVVDILKKI